MRVCCAVTTTARHGGVQHRDAGPHWLKPPTLLLLLLLTLLLLLLPLLLLLLLLLLGAPGLPQHCHPSNLTSPIVTSDT